MIVGVTGGIGSGKSTVTGMLAEHGAAVVDADAIARAVVVPGSPALQELAQSFGSDIVESTGQLNRALLAQRAFATAHGVASLNAIMHPRIRAEAHVRLRNSVGPVTVYDMPLLVETGQQDLVDAVVVVDLPIEAQLSRALASGRFDEADIRQRMRSQASREERLRHADYVIDNSGDLVSLRIAVDALWSQLMDRVATRVANSDD